MKKIKKERSTKHEEPGTDFVYEIGGIKYTQKELVLGQIEQIEPLLAGMEFSSGMTVMAIARQLVGKGIIARAAAVVLIPEGVNVQDKDLEEIEKNLRFNLTLKQAVRIVEDFFGCNELQSILESVMMQFVAMQARMITDQIKSQESTGSSAPSQTETLQKKTGSNGAAPGMTPGPISSEGKETTSSENQ